MGQARPLRAKALVVEDDRMQREMIGLLLEESDFDVIACESAEAAELVLQRNGAASTCMMTDVNLAGAHGRRRARPCRQAVQSGARRHRHLGQAAAAASAGLAQNSGPSRGRRSMSSARRSGCCCPRFCALGRGRALRPVRRPPRPRHDPAGGDDLAAPRLCRRLCRARRQAGVRGAVAGDARRQRIQKAGSEARRFGR